MLKSSNPTLSQEKIRAASAGTIDGKPIAAPGQDGGGFHQQPGNQASVSGTINKIGMLGLFLAMSFWGVWTIGINEGVEVGMTIGGIGAIIGLIMSFAIFGIPFIGGGNPARATVLAIPFAIAEGALMGGVSLAFEQSYPGIVIQAAMATVAVVASMFLLWRAGIIRLGPRGRRVVMTAFGGLFVFLAITWAMSAFGVGVPFLFDGGPLSIAFSLLILGICSLMLTVDFDIIVEAEAMGAPKYMEWYGAVALMVTIVWIYLEMLRLLSYLRD